MILRIFRSIRRLSLVLLFLSGYQNVFSQDAYMNMMDTNARGLFNSFIGVRLFASDFAATNINQDLQFKYTSNNLGYKYTFQHDLNVTGLNNFFNLGLGMNENYGKHLSITFFNASIGTIQHTWNWNIGTGAGYFVSLNKAQTMRLDASLDIYFESISYNFGDYYDTTNLGFIINQVNVGTSLRNVKYVNTVWSLSPGIEFLYRRSTFDYFAGAYFNYVFGYHEKINFYQTSIPVSYAIYDHNGNYISKDITNLGNYIIQIGIMREFGL